MSHNPTSPEAVKAGQRMIRTKLHKDWRSTCPFTAEHNDGEEAIKDVLRTAAWTDERIAWAGADERERQAAYLIGSPMITRLIRRKGRMGLLVPEQSLHPAARGFLRLERWVNGLSEYDLQSAYYGGSEVARAPLIRTDKYALLSDCVSVTKAPGLLNRIIAAALSRHWLSLRHLSHMDLPAEVFQEVYTGGHVGGYEALIGMPVVEAAYDIAREWANDMGEPFNPFAPLPVSVDRLFTDKDFSEYRKTVSINRAFQRALAEADPTFNTIH